MKRLILSIIALTIALAPFAQQKTQQRKKTATTVSKTAKTTGKTAKGKQTPKGKTTAKGKSKGGASKTATPTYTNASIKGLQGQRANIQKQIREQERALQANKEDVRRRLQDLEAIGGEISQRQRNIEGIQKDIRHLEGNIGMLEAQLQTLEAQLQERKRKYVRSMRYMSRHHSAQETLMFIFSARSLTQMYRRLAFVRQYSSFQKAQGEAVRNKQQQVAAKQQQLQTVRGSKHTLLSRGQQEKTALEGKQAEQQQMVQGLQKKQKTIQAVIADQKKKDAAINAQIDQLIAIEVEKARQRAAAEAKRKAEAAAAARKRAAELARKKAEAEARARENARRIAEARAREAKMKAEAEAAAKAAEEARRQQQALAEAKAKQRQQQEAERRQQEAAERRARAEQAAREAEASRKAAELKAQADAERSKKAIAEAREEAEETATLSTADRMLSGGFEANRGRLPMPITGSYRVVSHFGQYNVEGLKGVTLDNKGINIQGKPGCQARSIYDGEVSAVFGYGGMWNVLVRHGAYISVYCNLKSVSVSKGQRVSTRQAIGTVGTDNILQFQLRRETAKLNPEAWLGR